MMLLPRLSAPALTPRFGFLHRDRAGRPGLALDIMEEFRPYIVDRLALTLINLKQIQASGFQQTESGAISMDDSTPQDGSYRISETETGRN